MEAKSRRNQKITSSVFFGFALFYLLSSFRLSMGTLNNPGPGLIPVGIGGLLLLCTTVHLMGVFAKKSLAREPEADETRPARGRNYPAILGILASTIVYPVILEPLKFLVSTTTVAFVMLVLLKPQRPFSSFFLALGMAVASFVIFSRLLGVALPSGFLENLLFQIGR